MKIAISSTTQNIEDKIDETFGRCQYFIMAEIEDGQIKETKSIKNESNDQTSGAGVAMAQLMAEQKVEAVISGNIGPRALDVLKQFNIKAYLGSGTVKDAVQNLIDNKLEEIKQ